MLQRRGLAIDFTLSFWEKLLRLGKCIFRHVGANHFSE
ncbi:hypothetical protein DCCM_3092 [Desulfocucumis palustris]|uniref:Uncharacterized protein n=1 Tax=Desulfocucumis palustris TaxID=1898651 RepID=A0A2L2XJ75_9FIRM|nr:hypothetical protein DCCM_3092 [Desulfocucumis palustris]